MQSIVNTRKIDYLFLLSIGLLIILSVVVLRPIAPFLFPTYFLYIGLAILAFFIFTQVDFEIVSVFSKYLYIASIIFLLLPFLIGEISRGTVRWIPLGPLTIQPAEIVRPFLLVFFATYLADRDLNFLRILKALILLLLPVILILIQPSLGVSVVTAVGFLGVLMATKLKKKYLLFGALAFLLLLPLLWFLLAPYQKERITSFLDPSKDPLGSGYNSLQSMISVGSGQLLGRGLGKGVQTQLAFLPERHTDFVFAAVSEELGFVGGMLLLLGVFFLLLRLVNFMENSSSPVSRAYLSGFFVTLFVQVVVHIGMNVGLLPITGVPLPLVSAGGSSLVATMIGLGIASGATKL